MRPSICPGASPPCSIDRMTQVLARRPLHIPRITRLGWLMGLYAENHALLQRLFAPAGLPCGRHVSSVGDGLDVMLDVEARHAYTVELRLSYALLDPVRKIVFAGGTQEQREQLLLREWLVTNGLGGYASGTIGGAP